MTTEGKPISITIKKKVKKTTLFSDDEVEEKKPQSKPVRKIKNDDFKQEVVSKKEVKPIPLPSQTKGKSVLLQMKEYRERLKDSDRNHSLIEKETTQEGYNKVPIQSFGEAMLRGMGWNGSVDKTN
ncbi:Spp2/MOS2 G-patch domain-containing protein [Entamoeba marina]